MIHDFIKSVDIYNSTPHYGISFSFFTSAISNISPTMYGVFHKNKWFRKIGIHLSLFSGLILKHWAIVWFRNGKWGCFIPSFMYVCRKAKELGKGPSLKGKKPCEWTIKTPSLSDFPFEGFLKTENFCILLVKFCVIFETSRIFQMAFGLWSFLPIF